MKQQGVGDGGKIYSKLLEACFPGRTLPLTYRKRAVPNTRFW